MRRDLGDLRNNMSPSVRLTLGLLSFMLAVGLGSGIVGFIFGQAALRGITQPALNPFLNTADALKQRPQQGVTLAKERDLIAKVKAQTSGVGKKKNKPQSKASPTVKPSPKVDPKSSEQSPQSTSSSPKSFPLKAQDQGMNLEVRSVVREEDSLVLNVALTNQGSQSLKFLYSFLDITDDNGDVLFAETRGLPSQLPPKSETYIGTIRISDVLDGRVDKISLKLTDYPNQSLKLEVSDIPVPEK